MQDTVAWITGLAKTRGRNIAWARDAVVESRSSTDTEALRLHVIDLRAESLAALLTAIHGRRVTVNGADHRLVTADARVELVPMTARQRVLQVISNPNIAYLLLMLGFYGLLFEITHPGSWVPGIAGAVALLMALYGLQTLPTNYTGLALIVLAILLFIAEVKVTSYGFLSLAGAACLVMGSLMLIDSPAEFLQISLAVMIPIVVATAGVALGLGWLALRSQRRQVAVGLEGMIGRRAAVDRALTPSGKVAIDGEIWDAIADEPVGAGEEVEIVHVNEGMRLRVRKLTKEAL